MLLSSRIFAVIVLIIVFIVSLIQLGIGGAIVSNYAQYGHIFCREQGLSIYNIVISICGILISLVGLCAVATRRITFSKVVAFGCMLLALCTIGSLIAAVTINFLDAGSVNSRFFDYMKHYKDNADARNSIDRIQRNYACCGSNMWLDWDTVPLYAAPFDTNHSQGTGTTSGSHVSTTSTSTHRTTTQTTDEWDWLSNTDALSTVDNADVGAIVNEVDEPPTTTMHTSSKIVTETTRLTTKSTPTTRHITSKLTTKQHKHSPPTKSTDIPTPVNAKPDDDPFNFWGSGSSDNGFRKKREALAHHGNLDSLAVSYTVALPQSCCTHDSPSIFNSLDAYCISNANNAQNSFHRSGCANIVTKVAIAQAIAIAIVNAFLFIFALLAALLLQRTYAAVVAPPKAYRASSMQSQQVQYGGDRKNDIVKTTKTSVINYNNDYSIYQ